MWRRGFDFRTRWDHSVLLPKQTIAVRLRFYNQRTPFSSPMETKMTVLFWFQDYKHGFVPVPKLEKRVRFRFQNWKRQLFSISKMKRCHFSGLNYMEQSYLSSEACLVLRLRFCKVMNWLKSDSKAWQTVWFRLWTISDSSVLSLLSMSWSRFRFQRIVVGSVFIHRA